MTGDGNVPTPGATLDDRGRRIKQVDTLPPPECVENI